MKTKIIAFVNNKGGSGKTTTCANVGYCLSCLGRKVLLIDGDMQMNLSLSFFGEDEVLAFAESDKNLYEAVIKRDDLTDYIVSTSYENLDLIPSSGLMSQIEYELFSMEKRETIFKEIISKVKSKGKYDYILVDAPPTLGGWVMNILTATDEVVVPVEASPWGLFGIANMFDFLDKAAKSNKSLDVLGVALTKVDARKNYYHQTLEILQDADGVNVFENIIRVDSSVEWAQDNSMPIGAYKKSARSAIEYSELAKEIDKLCQ